MSNDDEPVDRRTEGVRIIGAQEAAEAAGRPDVVRRRRRDEKRFGDRPDVPEPVSDLPKVTISTTEGEGDGPSNEEYGGVVQPSAGSGGVGPGGDASSRVSGIYSEADRTGWGHARVVSDDPDDDWDRPTSSGDAQGERTWSRVQDDLYSPESWDEDPVADFDDPVANFDDEPSFEGEPRSSSYERGELGADLDSGLGSPVVEDDGDSFVLPHWTEPPTGQVPKVVVGEDAPEPEPLASYGSQPRWRDEGERAAAPGFDDLIDEGPALGALANDRMADEFFADEPHDELGEIDDGQLYDDEIDDEAARRTARSGGRRSDDDATRSTGSGGDRPLGQAILVGVALVAVGLLCFKLGALTTTVLAAFVVSFAAFEYFTAVRERGNNPATLLGMVSVAGLMVATSTSGFAAYPVVVGITVISGLLWYLWVAPGEGTVKNLGLTLLGIMWIGFLGSFATLFLGLGRVVEDASPDVTSNPGIGVLIAAVIASVSHDVGAYFVGRYMGRTPLSAASPNKTQEGLIGGVLASLIVTFVIVGVVGISPIGDQLAQAFIFALLCAIVAPLGDLCESFIKRDLGIKDMGQVLPGHGGVLDRFDALLFVLPVAYFVTVLFDVWNGAGT